MSKSEKESLEELIMSWRHLAASPMVHDNESMGYARCASQLEDFIEESEGEQ
jgi:hypothetical protein